MAKKKLKVYISVDMEGITGVNEFKDLFASDKGDYSYFRELMTQEANAAIEGALDAGAGEIIVRDAHGSALNILPKELNPEAKLIRQWAQTPLGMMDGIDAGFDAVIFIGYHAKAGVQHGVLKHTMIGNIMDLRINGISLAEATWNALIAGYYNVPVVFVSGDKAICDYVNQHLLNAETVAVKEGLGQGSINLHPDKAKSLIRSGVKIALKNISRIKPYRLKPPFTLEVQFKDERLTSKMSWYPGCKRVDDWTVSFTSSDFMECARFFFFGE
jgi:D-amino peptidase